MRTILLYATTTLFGMIFAIIFLGEGITWYNIMAIAIAGAGIFILRKRLAKDEESSSKIPI